MNERDKELRDQATLFEHDAINLAIFADLIRADERDKYEAQFKKLMRLHELRESQPNKPCCLNEREACAKICESFDELHPEAAFHRCAEGIRARGNP
jgi:hypothetical protein